MHIGENTVNKSTNNYNACSFSKELIKKFTFLVLLLLIVVSFSIAQANAGAIYLNGETGNDSNNGADAAMAVKTFAKAKELAVADSDISEILVTGTVGVSGDINLSGSNAKILRDRGFKGYLFNAKSTNLNLSNIVLDGGGVETEGLKSLIKLENATLTIGEDVVLQNNLIKNTAMSNGGAVNAVKSTINMKAGIIQNNQASYGGGIYLFKSVLNITGGNIRNNRAKTFYDRTVRQYYAAGGGVLAEEGSSVNISGDTLIDRNQSDEIGGGISIGGNDWSAGSSKLNMSGGIISNNSACAAGGGIMVNSNLRSINKATISAGKIINNIMNGKGRTNKAFGGGGIYVNGMPETYAGTGPWTSGELYISNVIITDNTANWDGGGYAACPISQTKILLENGSAIYNNHIAYGKKDSDEIYILCSFYYGIHSGTPEYEITDRMLGGQPYNWKDSKGNNLEKNKLKGRLTRNRESIKLYTDEVLSDDAKALAKVIISGNSSTTRGGGIGSNGKVFIGNHGDNINVDILKKWEEGTSPRDVSLQLRAKIGDIDWLIENVELNAQNGFKHKLFDLPSIINGNKIDKLLYVKEQPSPNYILKNMTISDRISENLLSFALIRNEFSNLENIYVNYSAPFEVVHKLVLEDGNNVIPLASGKITSDENFQFSGKMEFNNIPVDSDKISIAYYENDKEGDYGNYIAPDLKEYTIRLVKNSDGSYTLKCPKLFPISFSDNPQNLTGNEKVLYIENLHINKLNEKIVIIAENGSPVPSSPSQAYTLSQISKNGG